MIFILEIIAISIATVFLTGATLLITADYMIKARHKRDVERVLRRKAVKKEKLKEMS